MNNKLNKKIKKLTRIFVILIYTNLFGQNGQNQIDSLYRIINNSINTKEIIEAQSSLFINLFLAGQEKKALTFYYAGLESAKKTSYNKGLILLYNNFGTYLYTKNEFDSSDYYFKLTNKLAVENGDKEYALRSLSNIASIQFMNGDYKASLQNYTKCLSLEKDLGYEEGSKVSINNIGYIYNALAMDRKALQYFFKAEKLNSKLGRLSSLLYSYDGISVSYKALNQYDSAIFYSKEHYYLAIKLNDVYSQGYALNELGALNRMIKQSDSAIKFFKEGLGIYKKVNDFRLGMALYSNLSELYLNLNDSINAYKCLEKMMEFEHKFKISIDKKSFYPSFAKLAYYKKDYKSAFDYLNDYVNIKDSSFNLEVSQQINEISAKFETDKKEKENLLLQKENEKRLQEIASQKTVRNYLIAVIALGVLMFLMAILMFKKINRINGELHLKNKDIEEKNNTLTEQKKEILDSIHYAKRIQNTLLAHSDFVNEHIPHNFILFKPKDIVSGDFYWASKITSSQHHNLFFLAICDSTGHGVPGAFMSLLNIGFLSEAINEKGITEPGKIFNYVRQRLILSISKEGQKDGFDGILICLNKTTNTLTYSSANNAPVLIKNNDVLSLPYDKMPVGIGLKQGDFETHTIDISKNDTLYLYTDGYADQFGGPKGKKFMYKKLNQLLQQLSPLPLEEQKTILEKTFEEWRNNLEQVDDVCVIGIKL